MTDDNFDVLIEKLRGFFAHVTATEIMKRDIIYMTKDRTLWQAKELMRIRKISGVPVVDSRKHLIGLVSIEDIIVALEGNYISDSLEKHMTTNLITIEPVENLEMIMDKFNRHRYGRFPVVDKKGKLLGIITKKDILANILEHFRLIYVHDARRTEILNSTSEFFDRSLITGDYVEKESADFVFNIDYTDIDMAGVGAAKLKNYLTNLLKDESIARKVSIATYEAEVNVVIHSGSMGNIYCWVNDSQVKVRVEDSGKGVENIQQAMKEGYSTASDHVRELGFGAGMGLPNMKRYSNKMVVMSEVGKGVIVEMIFYI